MTINYKGCTDTKVMTVSSIKNTDSCSGPFHCLTSVNTVSTLYMMFKTQRQPGPCLPILDKGGRGALTTEVGTEQEGEWVTARHQQDHVSTSTLSHERVPMSLPLILSPNPRSQQTNTMTQHKLS